MIQPMRQYLLLACAAISISLGAAQSFAAAAFELGGNDTTLKADQLHFADAVKYVQSDYFKSSGKRCGTRRMPGVYDQKLERSVTDCTLSLTQIKSEYWPLVVYTIPVYWHVIHRSDGVGNISKDAIKAQMEVLNEDYRAKEGTMGSNGYDVKIQFELKGITRTQNDGWFSDSLADELAYKTALGMDQSKYLNIYTNDAQGYLGYAYYPQDNPGVRDGIVLFYLSVGGRNNGFSSYDQGRTLVHEMGHYLGLAHTFEGGALCGNTYSSGDLIVDTNAEDTDHYGCTQTFSCGSADPIYNYMNYTDDTCMQQFTMEQANRAVCSLVNYRADLYSVSGGGGGGGEIPTDPDFSLPPLISPLLLRNF